MTKTLRVGIATLWALAYSLLTTAAHADVAVPPLKSHVTDLTNTLSPDQVASLEQTLSAFEQRKGSQIAVLMIPTTQPEVIEQYSLRVAEAWKIGRKGIDDGVLLVIAKDDHSMRIETGYGVEGAVPDAVAKRVIREVITPPFRAGDFYLGIQQGIDRIIRAVDGEPLPPPTNRVRDNPSNNSRGIGQMLPFLLVAAFVIGGILRAIFGRMGGALIAGGTAGLIGWMMMRAIPLAAVFAVIGFFATLFGNNRGGWSNGSGGFGGGFGGGSGGGWSGGGGGFGGGGASGKW
jgi:uncharacterized protein